MTTINQVIKGTSTGKTGPNNPDNSTAVTVQLPTGITPNDGDELIVGIYLRSAITDTDWRVPAGWQLLQHPAETLGDGWFYRATYGSAVTGTSWTWDAGAGNTVQNRFAYGLLMLDGSVVSGYLGSDCASRSGTSGDTPTPIYTPNSSLSVTLVSLAGTRANDASWTWPSGWQSFLDTGANSVGTTNQPSATAAGFQTVPAPTAAYSVDPVASQSTSQGWSCIAAYQLR